jgi:hypothetical protein
MNKAKWAKFFWEGMTMRILMWTALAAGLLVAGGGAASAQDTVRLGGPAAQGEPQGATDALLMRGGGRGGGGFHGGYRGGYGYGRGYYGGFYGRGYGYGGFYGAGYWPYYYGGYYPYYTPYYYPAYYGVSYYPVAGDVSPPVTLTVQSNNYTQAPPAQASPQFLQGPFGTGTFPYDGGPRAPIPMPNPGDINPMKAPQGLVPLDGKLVSLSPTTITGGFLPDAPRNQKTNAPSAAPARVAYPAYGEEPIAPAPKKR